MLEAYLADLSTGVPAQRRQVHIASSGFEASEEVGPLDRRDCSESWKRAAQWPNR